MTLKSFKNKLKIGFFISWGPGTSFGTLAEIPLGIPMGVDGGTGAPCSCIYRAWRPSAADLGRGFKNIKNP